LPAIVETTCGLYLFMGSLNDHDDNDNAVYNTLNHYLVSGLSWTAFAYQT